MSKKCPKCGSNNVHLAATVPHALCVCFDCRHQWKNRYKPRKKTVFQQITTSPERLAETYMFNYDGKVFKSLLLPNMVFNSREEAYAATVERLKEVEK